VGRSASGLFSLAGASSLSSLIGAFSLSGSTLQVFLD